MSNYTSPPQYRMAWNRDDSVLLLLDTANTNPAQQSTAAMQYTNGEDASATIITPGTGSAGYVCIIFPELRDLDAVFVAGSTTGSIHTWQTSVDTTNGVDGTWVSQGAFTFDAVGNYRSNIEQKTVLGIKAVKFDANSYGGSSVPTYWQSLHLYGELSPNQTPDRLEIWDAGLDQRVDHTYFDWGDTPRASNDTRQFRVHNKSATKTAHSCRVAMDVPSDSSTPSLLTEFTLDSGSGATAQVNVGDLAPGATSAVITMRRSPTTSQAMGLWAIRVFASASGWV